MARPQKLGIEYFSLDVGEDDKIDLVESDFGIIGFGVLIKMWKKIYSEGYYYNWTEKEQLLFSKKISVDKTEVIKIISSCLKWGLFDQNKFDKYKILTSKGIQKRYFSTVYKRNKFNVFSEYLLIDVSDKKNVVVTMVSDISNEDISRVSDIQSTQSKVEDSKVKESKVEDSSVTATDNDNTEIMGANQKEDADPLLDTVPDIFIQVLDYFSLKSEIMFNSPKDIELAKSLSIDMPIDVIKKGIDEAFRKYNPKRPGEKIKTLKYCEGCIKDIWDIEKAKEAKPNGSNGFNGRYSKQNNENKGKLEFSEGTTRIYTDEELERAGIQ